jgi:hypothetical protein
MDTIRFIIREEIQLVLKESLKDNRLIHVYRCIDGDYKKDYNGIEFFQ